MRREARRGSLRRRRGLGVPESGGGGRARLEELSEELRGLAAALSCYAAEEKRRLQAAARARLSAGQLQALLAARYARSEALGLNLANPGWSLLLELFRASLERRPVRLARLAVDAHVPSTTALRWIEQFVAAGLVLHEAAPEREGGVLVALSEAGAEAMEDYFVAVQLGWAEAEPPVCSS